MHPMMTMMRLVPPPAAVFSRAPPLPCRAGASTAVVEERRHRRLCPQQFAYSSSSSSSSLSSARQQQQHHHHQWRQILWQQQHRILFPHRQQQLRALSASSPSTAASNSKGRGGAKNKGGAGGRIVNNAPDGAVKAKTATKNTSSSGRGGGGGGGRGKKKVDPNAPLSNEHLIAELFNRRRGEGGRSSGGVGVTADTLEVRLIVDRGRNAGGDSGDVGDGDGDGDSDSDSDSDTDSEDEDEGRGGGDDEDEDEGEESEDDENDDEGEDEGRDAKAGGLFDNATEEGGDSGSSSSPSPSPSPSAAATARSPSSPSSSSKSTNSQVTTLAHAITIAHEYSLDLVGVTLASNPPVIKAVDVERHLYDMKRRAAKAIKAKRRGGGGAISDRPLKEYKFRAGIAEHDLVRKANGMMEYLGRGHAVRVTLTARQRSLKDDADAIRTTLERVRELLGDKAVEARGMKSNDRNSYGTLLLHPSKK